MNRIRGFALTDDVVLKNYELRKLFHELREKHVSTSSSENSPLSNDGALKNYELRKLFHEPLKKRPAFANNVALKNYELRKLFHEPREKHVSTSSSEAFHLEELFEPPYEIELVETQRNDFFLFTRYMFEITTRRDLRMGETNDALAALFEE